MHVGCASFKGKRRYYENRSRYIGEIKTERAHGFVPAKPSNLPKKKNPIITVTEHTPTPSPDYLSKTRQVFIKTPNCLYI